MRIFRSLSSLLILLALLAACDVAALAPAPPTAAPSPTRSLEETPPPSPSPAPARPSEAPAPTLTVIATVAPTATAVPPTAAPTATAAPPTAAPTATAVPPTATPAHTALDGHVAAMRPVFASDIARNAHLPRYKLRMWIGPAQGVLTGTARIDFPNRTGAPLGDVALRLYPNFPRDVFGGGGDTRMDVTGASVAGAAVEVAYAAERTAVLLPLVPPLDPGGSTTLAITFTATLTPWSDGTWPLPSYYPLLAVHADDGWRLDITRFADHVYAESALYEAEISIPAGLKVIASGSTVGVDESGGRAFYHIYTGPVREFALSVGDFVGVQELAGDVTVNVFTARGSRLDAQQIARVSAAALANFDRRFGQYPYGELDIQLLPGDFDGGDEFPGMVLVYSDRQVDAGTRYVAAHEVAHQWWYGTVGNDIYRQPWLDEAFAQYSAIIYDEDVEGPAVAADDWEREVMRRYRGALSDGDLPVGRAIDGYPNFNVYYRTVYGKGAVFLRTLRQTIGDEAFFRGLQIYHQRHRYGVATTQDVQRAFEEASGHDLGQLFRAWVLERG